MAKIVPKLNLNRTPQSADNASLIYAKNIRLNKDGTISPDYDFISTAVGWDNYFATDNNHPVVGYIVGLNSKVYYFIHYVNTIKSVYGDKYSKEITKIIEYNELDDTVKDIDSNWTYSGGVITGFVTTNQTGEEILTICEYAGDNVEIPIKHINLDHPKVADESIYTQNPIIPITNLHLIDTYTKNIPNGVYQFFLRYKISENFYTPWIPCSKECFAGTTTKIDTISGSVKYVDIKRDSGKSFVFSVEHLQDNVANYIAFQVGFILSHDDEIVARTWKEFEMTTSKIYFDYDKNYIEEIDIDEFTRANFEIFNVQNAAFFKNKCYVSNYKETNFNPDFSDYAKQIDVELVSKSVFNTSADTAYFNDTLLTFNGTYYTCNTTFFGKEYYVKSTTTESETLDKEEILKFTYYYDLDMRPDVMWIRKSEGIIEFNDLGSYFTTYATPVHIGEDYFLTCNDKHPLQSNYIFMNNWYYSGNSFKTVNNNSFNQSDLTKFCESTETKAWDYIRSIFGNFDGCLLTRFSINIAGASSPVMIDLGVDMTEIDEDDITNTVGKTFQSEKSMRDWIDSQISSYILGFTADRQNYYGKVRGKLTDSGNIREYVGAISGYSITYTTITKEESEFTKNMDSDQQENTMTFNATKSIFTDNILITPNQSKFVVIADANNNTAKLKQYTSLMPFTTYEFYIHFVKNNGVYTNGYKICDASIDEYPSGNNTATIIYPRFTSVNVPNGYVGYFISINKTGDDVCRLFDRRTYQLGSGGTEYVTYDCIEEDARLYNLNDNIRIISNLGVEITNTAKYYSSGETDPIYMFGNSGSVAYTPSTLGETNAWMTVVSKDNHSESTKQLIKITPFIYKDKDSYEDYEKMNLPAYLCKVYKIDKNIENGFYCAGTDMYEKVINDATIELEKIENAANIFSTEVRYILSNFNLNYLTLTEDINTTIRSYGEGSNSGTQVVRMINTLTCSDIYELPNMYKEYTRKYYSIVNNYSKVKFDNTIRSSDTNTDEVYRDIFTFYSSDYYNVPCNRGPIVSMFSIADYIYVHCKHSLYRFTGSTSLTSNSGEVQTKETNVFDSGIKEIFDSEFGFGGLKLKTQSLVSYFAYVFYDAYANKIYSFSGEGQLSCISDSIKKIMDNYNINDVKFVDDYHNDRFFVNLITDEGNICLSYSYIGKAFISLHDIDFIKGFCTRHNTYFLYSSESTSSIAIKKTSHKIYKISNKVVEVPIQTSISAGNIYTGLYKESLITPSDVTNTCCIDVIFNSNYEIIKEIDKVSWVCNAIKSFFDGIYMAEESLEQYPGDKIKIYTDECATDFITMATKTSPTINKRIQNNESYSKYTIVDGIKQQMVNPNSYAYPRYNCGVWSLNYFRDIRNKEDKFKYNDYNDKSLIYGKYFVVRFVFGITNCKIENIDILINNYDKV